MRAITVVVSGPKFTIFLFSSRVILLDNAVDLLSISQSTSEIFAVKVKSQKLSYVAPNFGRFLPSQILRGRCLPKVLPGLTHPPSGTSRGKVL